MAVRRPEEARDISDQEPRACDAGGRENEDSHERDGEKRRIVLTAKGPARSRRDLPGTEAARAVAGRRPRRPQPVGAPSRRLLAKSFPNLRPRGSTFRQGRARARRAPGLRRARRSSPSGSLRRPRGPVGHQGRSASRCAPSTRRPAACSASRARSRRARTQLRDGPRTARSERTGRRRRTQARRRRTPALRLEPTAPTGARHRSWAALRATARRTHP